MTETHQIARTRYLDRAKTGQIYFRIKGRKTRLPDDEDSPEFAAAYDRLLEDARKPVRVSKRTDRIDLKQLRPGSYVYFVQCGDLVKIGVSSRPVSRLCHMQGNSSLPLTVLGTVRGGRDVERFIHRLFRKYRKHGEWFSIAGSFAEFLREHFPSEWKQ